MGKKLIVMVGLPYSGKSTVVDKLAKVKNAVIVCPDNIRMALHGHAFINEAESFVWASSFLMIRSLLARHDTVIVDACHASHKQREAYLQFFHGNYKVDEICFTCMNKVNKETCKARLNEKYGVEYSEHRDIMLKVIDRMAKNLTWPDEFDFDEKYHERLSMSSYSEK